MLSDQDKKLISYFRAQPQKEATAAEVMDALGYLSVGAVNLHVVRLAKDIAGFLSYSPTIRSNGQRRWWPCLFDGRDEKHGFVWTLRKEVEDWYVGTYADEPKKSSRVVRSHQIRRLTGQADQQLRA